MLSEHKKQIDTLVINKEAYTENFKLVIQLAFMQDALSGEINISDLHDLMSFYSDESNHAIRGRLRSKLDDIIGQDCYDFIDYVRNAFKRVPDAYIIRPDGIDIIEITTTHGLSKEKLLDYADLDSAIDFNFSSLFRVRVFEHSTRFGSAIEHDLQNILYKRIEST